jgi:hypothetical protein
MGAEIAHRVVGTHLYPERQEFSMQRKTVPWLIGVAASIGLIACGPSEDELALAQLDKDMATANAAIDSLNYTVESSNLLIDGLRAQVDSTSHVNEQLLVNVQKLSREVREYRQMAAEYKQSNQKLTDEIRRLQVEKQADRQTIATMRSEADSLAGAMLDAHTSIRRQSDQIREMEVELAQTRDEVADLRKADQGVSVFIGSESFLKENGYLKVNRSLGRALRKVFHLTKTLNPGDPDVQLVGIGDSIVITGNLDVIVDRYGKLDKGDDYSVQKEGGQTTVTFLNQMLGGVDVVAVLKD